MCKSGKKTQFVAGLRAGIPIILGFIPVGIAYAVMARQAGFTAAETVLMSMAVFAGASQMMAVGMYAQGASVTAMILAAFILNLRHLIMSTCVIRKVNDEKMGLKLLASFGVTDETFAVFTTEKEEHSSICFFFGVALAAYASWVLSSAVGTVAAVLIPEILSASFGIALYAMFIGLLVPNITSNRKLGILVLITAAVNTVLSQFLASSRALIISTLLCAAVGAFFVDLNEETEADSDAA